MKAQGPSPNTAVIVVMVVAIFSGGLGYLVSAALRPTSPGDTSAEAGFARDMVVHHEQAMEMAEIVRARTRDPLIRTLATDIVLTQQSQTGRFQGWLDGWGLPATGTEHPMTWMGHPTPGPIPGMASPQDVTSLRSVRRCLHHHDVGPGQDGDTSRRCDGAATSGDRRGADTRARDSGRR